MTDRLLIQGDSLPLPRQSVAYEETWPAQLRADDTYGTVVNRSQSGKTTDALHREKVRFPKRVLESYAPDSIVLQMGIVDCAPRLLSEGEKDFLTACPLDRLTRVGGHMLKYIRSRSRNRAYVAAADFEANIRDFFRHAQYADVDTVVAVKILTAGEKYEAANPTVQSAITDYNDILGDVAADYPVVETMRPLAGSRAEEAEIVDDYTLDDGYHFDERGHERVFERLLTDTSLGTKQNSTPAQVD